MSENSERPLPAQPQFRQAHPRWIQIGVLLVVFSAGGVVGATVAVRYIHVQMEYYRANADALPNVIAPRLQAALQLSDEQATEVLAILKERHPRIVEHRASAAKDMHQEFDTMELEIARLLDEQQSEKWKSFAARVRSRYLPPAG